MRPLLLDLFCCQGGASVGYSMAGFDVVGVDSTPQPRYPFPLHVGDVLDVLDALVDGAPVLFGDRRHVLADFSAVAASPPCHDHTTLAALSGTDGTAHLLEATRRHLVALGLPYVIENVPGAPLIDPLQLCGTEFGLQAVCRDGVLRVLRRHRHFESNVWLMGAGGCAHGTSPVLGFYGTGGSGQMTRGFKGHPTDAPTALGIDWMTTAGLAQAIPPAYTQHVGTQVLSCL